jgi:hypothetical protein
VQDQVVHAGALGRLHHLLGVHLAEAGDVF